MPRRHARTPIWVWPVLLVLVVALAATLGYAFLNPTVPDAEDDPAPNQPRVQPGQAVYLWVKSVEVTERMPNGNRWDRFDNSAPDVFFELTYRDTVLQTSAVNKDALIAQWSLVNIGIDLGDLAATIEVDPTQLIAAPLVKPDADDTATLRFIDNDAAPLGNEDIATVTLTLTDLNLGENVIQPGPISNDPDADPSAIRRLVVVVLADPIALTTLVEQVNGTDPPTDD